jgi:hypothetical protein
LFPASFTGTHPVIRHTIPIGTVFHDVFWLGFCGWLFHQSEVMTQLNGGFGGALK